MRNQKGGALLLENTRTINDIIRETGSVGAVQSASSMSCQNYFQQVIVKLRYSLYHNVLIINLIVVHNRIF